MHRAYIYDGRQFAYVRQRVNVCSGAVPGTQQHMVKPVFGEGAARAHVGRWGASHEAGGGCELRLVGCSACRCACRHARFLAKPTTKAATAFVRM